MTLPHLPTATTSASISRAGAGTKSSSLLAIWLEVVTLFLWFGIDGAARVALKIRGEEEEELRQRQPGRHMFRQEHPVSVRMIVVDRDPGSLLAGSLMIRTTDLKTETSHDVHQSARTFG